MFKQALTLGFSFFLVVTAIVTTGCTDSKTESSMSEPQGEPAASTVEPSGEMVQDTPPNQGKVLQHIAVSGYTYLEVDSNGQKIWMAGSPIEVQEGDMIGWEKPAVMNNFYSKTLDRTFDEILFVNKLFKPGAPAAATGPAHGMPPTMAAPASASEPAQMAAAVNPGQGAVHTKMQQATPILK